MIRLLLNTVFLFLSFQAIGQFELCDSLIIRGHMSLFDHEGINTTFDYVKTYYPKQRRFISDRNELDAINLWVNTDSIMLFKEGSDEIKITFGKDVVDYKVIFYPKNEDEPFSRIREYREGYPFGITSEDTTASQITKIIVNGKKLPLASFADLLNPNRYETNFSIKPIRVYRSACDHYFFIYIFGKPDTGIMTFHESLDFSYMAKIIVTVKGYYVDRIVVPGDKLKYFGFGECPYFIGF